MMKWGWPFLRLSCGSCSLASSDFEKNSWVLSQPFLRSGCLRRVFDLRHGFYDHPRLCGHLDHEGLGDLSAKQGLLWVAEGRFWNVLDAKLFSVDFVDPEKLTNSMFLKEFETT